MIFGPWPPNPLTQPNTAGSHLHRALAAVLAEILHMTRAGLAQPANQLSPVIQNPRVQVRGDCSLPQKDSKASVPRASAGESHGAPVPGAGLSAQELL